MASKRRRALDQLAAILGAVSPAGGYVNDLTGAMAVGVQQGTMQGVREMGLPSVVRLRDGDEETERGSITGNLMNCRATYIAEMYQRVVGDETLVDAMNDLIADVRLAVDKNTTLNGVVIDAFCTAVEAPLYNFDQQEATCRLQFSAMYTLEQGTEI